MSVKSCLLGVNFDQNVLIYQAAGNISGNLVFNGGAKGNKLYDVKLTLIRRTDYVLYTEQVGKGKATSLINKLDKINSSPCGSWSLQKSSADGTYLPPDTPTKISFSLPLPLDLWSSFVVTNAFSWYGLMLTARSQSQYGRKETFILKRDILMIGNVEKDKVPFSEPLKKITTFTTPAKEEVKMRVCLKTRCATPGDRVPFRVEVWNGKSLPLSVKATLQQNIGYKFIARFRMHMKTSEANIVWHGESGTFLEGKSEWRGDVEIPYVAPTGLGREGCPNFTVNYMLKFVIPRFAKIETELHIGTATRDEGASAELGGDDISLAYGLEVTRSLSSSQYSLDWNALSLASEDSGCWTLVEDEE
ncbi:uncharacterized protein LOC118433297 [Folsomia candida]|uniref:Uncharacterized protein n=1 Tax=Folsomia candida TaxID=158441 RepID=A0A226CY62_FOLCA|nr:uncharacterized protein LOC118433297 [Folsomia candida]XP_035700980.1 uncharacterized protein LOC118433297 [Folsomia candida]OXA38265.1 hypothetical protein Fcan01_27035 [Folsomia candida]